MPFSGDTAFLRAWEAVLRDRVAQVAAAFAGVTGVRGLILGGSLGGGVPWPLSDIDLLPIYEDALAEGARTAVARERVLLLERWEREGWRTALDVGDLAFTRGEVLAVAGGGGPPLQELLADRRWYHSLDKGYGGEALRDPEGLAEALTRWFTATRFSPPVVAFRVDRQRRDIERAHRQLLGRVQREDMLAGTIALREGVEAARTLLLERWGERDTSFARFGTRFERAARARGREDLIAALNDLSALDDRAVPRRLRAAPDWVRQRHARSWRARRHIGEEVTQTQDARDVLRVFGRYELRKATALAMPTWLAVEPDAMALARKTERVSRLLDEIFERRPPVHESDMVS